MCGSLVTGAGKSFLIINAYNLLRFQRVIILPYCEHKWSDHIQGLPLQIVYFAYVVLVYIYAEGQPRDFPYRRMLFHKLIIIFCS